MLICVTGWLLLQENWCYDRKSLYSFAKHYSTGEPLPEEYFNRLKAAKTFRSGTMMLRQVRTTTQALPFQQHLPSHIRTLSFKLPDAC